MTPSVLLDENLRTPSVKNRTPGRLSFVANAFGVEFLSKLGFHCAVTVQGSDKPMVLRYWVSRDRTWSEISAKVRFFTKSQQKSEFCTEWVPLQYDNAGRTA